MFTNSQRLLIIDGRVFFLTTSSDRGDFDQSDCVLKCTTVVDITINQLKFEQIIWITTVTFIRSSTVEVDGHESH